MRENERRDFMIDEMSKTKKLKREFLDVCELSKVKREMLAFEKENDLLILLIYISIRLVYEVWLCRYEIIQSILIYI